MSADIHSEAFIQEAQELLQELESSLLELEEDTENTELIARIFRAMHTIKGSGAMFGFENIAHFVHDIETAYDMVRNGELRVSKPMLDYSFKSCDVIKQMLEDDSIRAEGGEALEIITFFRGCRKDGGAAQVSAPQHKEEKEQEPERTYRIRFEPSENIFLTGTNPAMLLEELQAMGECEIITHITKIPDFEELDPERCYTFWDVILTTSMTENDIRDVFMFVEDESILKIDVIYESGLDEENYRKLGEILVEKGDVSAEALSAVISEKKMIGEMLIEKGLVEQDAVVSALEEQKYIKNLKAKKAATENNTSLRVPSEKLDSLVDLVGELVTVQARLNQTAISMGDSGLSKIAEDVERLVWELRDNTMSIRMLQIGTTFSKYKRLVRDLAKDLGKDIELVTKGEETELDKTVIEKLGDPLVHLVRNSVDHGIELPEDRIAAGKSPRGKITLSAEHSGDSVLIRITDDGKGLDKKVLMKKAVEKGLISESAELSSKEAFELIFLPGFSTAAAVSNISGRGVGMDVVKRNIEALRGTIEIDSTLGKGTEIVLKLPLTLAIIDGLLVRIGEQFFIIPLSMVNECIEFKEALHRTESGRCILKVRDDLIPYLKLRSIFFIPEEEPEIQQIVILDIENNRIGFVVDSVIGDHQTVIKSLGKSFKKVECISGASVLGDGSIALIIDVMKIYNSVG